MTVAGSHVWVASLVSIVVLGLATLVVFGWKTAVVRKLVIGADGRASTSKFQAAAWTYVICFALLVLLVGHLLYADFDPAWDALLKSGLNSDYLWLLGIPSVGLVGAKAITQTQVAGDPTAKPAKPATETNGVMTRIRELGTNDNDEDPQPVLADLQYVVFNLIALAFFLSAFLGAVGKGLPSLPDTLIALTGVSAASYLATKAASRTAAPTIVSVRPRVVVLGAATTDLTISGTGFTPEGTQGEPHAMLGGVDLDVGPGATDTLLVVTVPESAAATAKGLTPGTLDLVVLSAAGTPSEPTQIVVS